MADHTKISHSEIQEYINFCPLFVR